MQAHRLNQQPPGPVPPSPPSLRSLLLGGKPPATMTAEADPSGRFPRLRRFWSDRKSTPPVTPPISPPSRLAPAIAYSPSPTYTNLPASPSLSEYPSFVGSSFSSSHPLNMLRPHPTRAPPSTPVSLFRSFLRPRRASDSPDTPVSPATADFQASPWSADTSPPASPRNRDSWASSPLARFRSRQLGDSELYPVSLSEPAFDTVFADLPQLDDPFPSALDLQAPSIDINFDFEDDDAWRGTEAFSRWEHWEIGTTRSLLVDMPGLSDDDGMRAVRRGMRHLSIDLGDSPPQSPQVPVRRASSNPILSLSSSQIAAAQPYPAPLPYPLEAVPLAVSPLDSLAGVPRTPRSARTDAPKKLPFDLSPTRAKVSPGKTLIPSKYARPSAGARRQSTASDMSAHFPFLAEDAARAAASDESTTLPASMTATRPLAERKETDYAPSPPALVPSRTLNLDPPLTFYAQLHAGTSGGSSPSSDELVGAKREQVPRARTPGKRKKVRRTRSVELALAEAGIGEAL